MHPFPLSQVLDEHRAELVALVRTLRPDLSAKTPEARLVALAFPGLHDAHRRFDPGTTTSFWSYAVHRVRGAVLDDLAADARARRRPPRVLPADPVACPETALARAQTEAALGAGIEALDTRERIVVRGVYYEERCLDDLGVQLGGLSRSWVSRIHTGALRRLRERLER